MNGAFIVAGLSRVRRRARESPAQKRPGCRTLESPATMRVLADDFSGAAEVAGVGFRYGLQAAVQLDSQVPAPHRELAVLDIDSRSKSEGEAVGLVESALDRGRIVFKKIDSVLRGHVVAEIRPFLESKRYSRALVVPFNPDLGRGIRNGVYRVHDVPISHTPFRDDPEYPITTSDVLTMLGAGEGVVRLCRLSDALPDTGIVIGEGETFEELEAWADRVDAKTVPVGGAPFFAAWLKSRGTRAGRPPCPEAGQTTLVVSGTTSRVVDWRSVREEGVVRLLAMPEAVFEGSQEDVSGWAADVVATLDATGVAVVSIGGARLLDRSQSPRLAARLAEVAASVLTRRPVDQLWLEGGATASAVVRQMGWISLDVVGEAAPGVVQLRPVSGGPLITVKPGSYPWRRGVVGCQPKAV
ncbi:MAG: four-carbon acid sugar kinase family protein [Acidobacteria bacterium]|nr:MAG: four-carbon acid sugar kinase family protein [Acidobacteriota bacterium]